MSREPQRGRPPRVPGGLDRITVWLPRDWLAMLDAPGREHSRQETIRRAIARELGLPYGRIGRRLRGPIDDR